MATADYYDTYWDEHRALTGTYRELEQLLTENAAGRCLDIGCGDGRTAGDWLNAHAASYTGVDISHQAINEARQRGLDAQVVGNPARLPFPDRSYETIVCLEVLEHLVDPLAVAREARRLLAPNGRLLVTVPNIAYWRRRLDMLLVGRWNPMGDQLSVAQPWRDPHLRFFTARTLRDMLETAGLDAQVGGHWGGLLVDLPGRNRLGLGRSGDVNNLRPSSSVYRTLERRWPGLLAFRLHAISQNRAG